MKTSAYALFAWPNFRRLFITTACATLASRALAVVLSFKVYDLTGDPLALGGLGLIEAIPSLSLALYGGHIADRHNRRWILRWTIGALVICAFALAALQFGVAIVPESQQKVINLAGLYVVIFIAGIARGFAEPAGTALEAQVVPFEYLMHSSTLMASSWLGAGVIGPLVGAAVLAQFGAGATFCLIGTLYLAAWIAISRMSALPSPAPPETETMWESLTGGVKYVMNDQVMLGAMSLDLFAVLFGGAIALLPVFASDILHVGANELGWLNAAPTAGALVTMVWATRTPPVRHAGRNLLVAVAGFSVAMIVFAVSKSLILSLVALFVSGMCDGVSVVIRRAIVRMMAPDHLRGRIAAVSMIFIGSSNELGAFESGIAAHALGTSESVWMGAIVSLFVVVIVAITAPKLRNLSLDPSRTIERVAEVDEQLDAQLETS